MLQTKLDWNDDLGFHKNPTPSSLCNLCNSMSLLYVCSYFVTLLSMPQLIKMEINYFVVLFNVSHFSETLVINILKQTLIIEALLLTHWDACADLIVCVCGEFSSVLNVYFVSVNVMYVMFCYILTCYNKTRPCWKSFVVWKYLCGGGGGVCVCVCVCHMTILSLTCESTYLK